MRHKVIMREDKIPIYLSKKEIELFKKFREYQSIWEEVFETKGGKVILHFDNKGILRMGEIEHIFYKA